MPTIVVQKACPNGVVHMRIEEGGETLGLVDAHVSDRYGCTIREINTFNPKVLMMKELILDTAYQAQHHKMHRRET
jgi:hypothetical protein